MRQRDHLTQRVFRAQHVGDTWVIANSFVRDRQTARRQRFQLQRTIGIRAG